MQFSSTGVDGAFVVGPERHADDRGFFARTFCETEFGARGLDRHFPQANISNNTLRGTLRGLHGEPLPSAESKLVRCAVGAIYDVVVDLRPASPTFLRWDSVELTRDNGKAIYIPAGCAHGFLTLVDDVDVLYSMGSAFRPGSSRCVRWDDPAFGILWPFTPVVMSERDAGAADYEPEVWSS